MNGKYIKKTKIVIPMITILMATSLLFGCGSVTQDEAQKLINENPTVEVVVDDSIEEEPIEGETQTSSIPWIEVGSLEDLPELRKSFDELFGVTGDAGSKTGWAYTSQNITLKDAMGNEKSIVILYDYESPERKTLASIADENFTDTEDLTDEEKIAVVINEYFNLLPSNADGNSNPYEALTRAQAMSLLMRATTPVSDIKENKDFAKAVGDSDYNIYAQEVNELAFINTLDGSLNADMYGQPMTKAEAVYMVVQAFYQSEYNSNAYAENELSFTDITENTEVTGETNSEALNFMLENNGVDNRIIEAYKIASYHNLLGSDVTETDWNESITKTEFIGLLVKAMTPAFEEEPTPTETITDNNNSITYQSDGETTTTPPSSTSDTSDIDYDSIDFGAILDKTETDPSSLTDAEVAYLKKLYTDLPKEPRKMSVSDWSAYWDKEFGVTTSTPSTTTSDCTYQQDDPADCTEYKEGDVAPNGMKAGHSGDCMDPDIDCAYIVG